MPQLKVIAPKLNQRKSPVVDFANKDNIVGVLHQGATFNSVRTIENELGLWHGDDDGNWASDNWLREEKWRFDATKMSWAHDSITNGGVGIVDLWNSMGVRGESINVLILDTGITANNDQFTRENISIIKANECIDELKVRPNDVAGHGTNSASIIGATGNDKGQNILYGVAPNVNLYIVKFAGSISANPDKFLAGLRMIDPAWPIDIISISFCYSNVDPLVKEFFTSKVKESCLVLSALNHPEQGGVSINNTQFPAIYDNVIPVAASMQSLKSVLTPCEMINNTNKRNWVFPGEHIKVLNHRGEYVFADQSSVATPFAAGVMALFLSYMKKRGIEINKNSIAILINLINQSCDSPVQIPNLDGKICFCNPVNAFAQFNKYFKSLL